MNQATSTYLLMKAFVDELARCGMRDACTSPGSRSTPIVLSLARESRLRCHSHIDERCAGFFALGLAKASGLPVAVTCTSGTATAELLPAAIEAHEARVPLLLLTADRPAELREIGAGQAIDQMKLFGSAAKWFFEVELERASEQRLRWMRTLACRAYWTALEGRQGVVHLNFPLREPLISDGPLPADDTARAGSEPYVRRLALAGAPIVARAGTLASGQAFAERTPPEQTPLDALARLRTLVSKARRGVLVAGRDERIGERDARRDASSRDESLLADCSATAAAAAAFCAANGWALLADPLSRARRGAGAIAHYDALLRDESFAAAIRPDLVLRIGDLPTSKPLRSWLGGLEGVPQVALDREGAWQDPASVLSESFALDPASALSALTAESHLAAPTSLSPTRSVKIAEDGWLASWRAADERAAEAINARLAGGLSEPAVAAELGVLLPAEATLFVASSMPVRDIESFWPVRKDPPRVLCNRGANGIDGTISSAFGAAAASRGPTVLLIGDVAFAHDLGGLLAAERLDLALTIVLLNNEGGGIFDFLPVAAATEREVYTRHIATPTGLDFGKAAALYGLEHERVTDRRAFREALERAFTSPHGAIVEVPGERAANVQLHADIGEAVVNALEG